MDLSFPNDPIHAFILGMNVGASLMLIVEYIRRWLYPRTTTTIHHYHDKADKP